MTRRLTKKDGKFLGEETVKGLVFSRTVLSYELQCNCGAVFYPKYDFERNEWIGCVAEGGENADFSSVLACSKECLMVMRGVDIGKWKTASAKKREIFSTCEYCEDMIPKGKRSCNACKTKFQDEKKVLAEVKREKKKKEKFEKGMYQGGSPGLVNGSRDRFK